MPNPTVSDYGPEGPIVTAYVGVNADVLPKILALYVPEGSVIADVTYNRGAFWKKTDLTKYWLLASDIARVNNSIVADMAHLPYRDNSLDAIVIDPPYGHGTSPNMKRPMGEQYGLTLVGGPRTVGLLYSLAADEASRVLRPGGVAIVKCQDMVDSSKQHWMMERVYEAFTCFGMHLKDRFIVVQPNIPMMRHSYQHHARKNHSYFLVFKKPGSRSRA